jgi:secondary thiamine-phosphate synthase enzyme
MIDITAQVRTVLTKHKISAGLINVYVQGATAGIMIQENWDESVQEDILTLLKRLVPKGIWTHDRQDNNGDAHIKSGLVGPSECIPVINGELGLSTWQNIFLCEFDGPRENRQIIVTIIGSR